MATTRTKKSKKEEKESPSLGDLLGMDAPPVPIVDEVVKSTKLSPFDYLSSITFSKTNLIVDEDTEKQYVPFIVNRGLSNSMDCIIYANEMNCRPHIDKKQQYTFLLRTIVKRKRYDKWAKKVEVENLDLIMTYYGFSAEKAMTALAILNEEQVEYIKQKMSKGGLKKC